MKPPFRRNTLLAALAASFITFLIMAATRPEPQTLFVTADNAILPGPPLDRIIPEFDAKNMPFQDAVLQLSRQLGIPIRIRTQTLQAADEDLDAPVTIHLINARAATILDEAFRIVDQEEKLPKLAYWKSNDGIEISTEDDAAQLSVINRIYFVTDVVQNIVTLDRGPGEPAADPTPGTSAGTAPNTISTWAEANEALIKFIEDTVAVNSWKDNGGSIGAISTLDYSGLLIVQQTRSNQAQIAALLDRLAKIKSSRPFPGATTSPGKPLLEWRDNQ